ncbi:MAG: IS200/IS605 family accessory protein TnpB-related protein, partial [Selenomonadaceae bacterium]|nr:IS200/IS605 family accessory protein TnpB-related protein [Selenomonadaceae bacterium]
TDLVIGHNKGWKQDINIGKVNNQNFVSIPFNRLIEMISYKSELSGIKIHLQEESYTSKASFLDLDQIPTFEASKVDLMKHKFSGKRVKRGLYKSRNKSLINADVNGSLNIMRKYVKVAKKDIKFDFVEASSAPAVFTVKL